MIENSQQKLKELVSKDLEKVNEIILLFAKGRSSEIIDVISQHINSSGGKRLRPILTLIASKLFNTINSENHVYLAAAVEFIHTATLLHDDVIDESITRRGVKTANNIWGNKLSILVGDYLFSQSFKLMVKTNMIEVLKTLSDASAIISEGEIRELQLIKDINMSLDTYINLITAKTAVLFSAACEVGALASNAKRDEVEALKEYGLNLGICFQITDDLLDYFAQDAQFGKKLGNDFYEGKMTIPLIAISADNDIIKAQVKNLLIKEDKKDEDFLDMVDVLKSNDSQAKVQKIAQRHIDRGIKALGILPDSNIKNLLIDIINSSITRSY